MKTSDNFHWSLISPLLVSILQVYSENVYPIVTTSLGKLIGRHVPVDNQINKPPMFVKEFLAVPFAKPPLGDLRFRKPEPVKPWGRDRNLMCHTQPPACPQYTDVEHVLYPWILKDTPPVREDCLYMNIWTPKDCGLTEKIPVLFFIHGGGYFESTGSARETIYEGQVLSALGDIVVVVPNYRLGSLGFWTINTTDAPGNVGIWDVIEALRWVNEHIGKFGGDKTKITIAGQGFGAVIVSLLAVTPHARHLFKRQIVQSGSAMWSLSDDPTVEIVKSQDLAVDMVCASKLDTIFNNREGVTECMREIDAMKLTEGKNFFYPFWGDELFPTNPREALLKTNFTFGELLIGISGFEGTPLLIRKDPSLFGALGRYHPTFSRSDAKSFIRKETTHYKEAELTYFPKDEADNECNAERIDWKLLVADVAADSLTVCPTIFYASFLARSGVKVYFYNFQYRPSNSIWADWMGPTHFDEVDFIFGGPFKSLPSYPQEERKLSKMMIKHWAEFVKIGKPSDEWPIYSKFYETMVYQGGLQVEKERGPIGTPCKFWQNIIYPSENFTLPDFMYEALPDFLRENFA